MYRVGNGYDVHQLVSDRKLVIGGVLIPHHKGLLGHSDADVLVHAVIDALLGAAGKGVIGQYFPDSDSAYKDISSLKLLKQTMVIISEDYSIVNIDTTIIAEEPKMMPHFLKIKQNLATVMAIDIEKINIKATTTEKLGAMGRGEGIAALATVLLKVKNAG